MKKAARRTLQKVRRDSKPVGSIEGDLWRPTDKRSMRLALRAAERYDRAHKIKGRRNGPLGHVGLEVYRALWSRIRFTDGCLCPSLEWIMQATRRSKAAVVGALKRLKALGFVAWRRRLEYTGGRGVRGPQVQQATNAYALGSPQEALDLIGNTILPDDERTRLRQKAAFLAECASDAFDATPLGAAFMRWERGLTNASLRGDLNPSLGSIKVSAFGAARL